MQFARLGSSSWPLSDSERSESSGEPRLSMRTLSPWACSWVSCLCRCRCSRSKFSSWCWLLLSISSSFCGGERGNSKIYHIWLWMFFLIIMCADHVHAVLYRSRLGQTSVDHNWNDLVCFGGTSCCAPACTSNAVMQSDVRRWVRNGCLKVCRLVATNMTLSIV